MLQQIQHIKRPVYNTAQTYRPVNRLLAFAGAQDRYQPQQSGQRLMIVSETWNQINGVSTTIDNLVKQLKQRDYTVEVLHPALFPTIPTNYPDMRISNPFGLKKKVAQKIEAFKPERIFILTEGPLGWATKNYCQQKGLPYTTSYSVKWDDYFKKHFHLPRNAAFKWLKGFHEKATAVLVITPSLLQDLGSRGFKNLVLWRQAIDTDRFNLMSETARQQFVDQHGLAKYKRPFYLYVGRVSSEKNIKSFLNAELPGTKLVVGPEGAGCSLDKLRKQYPDVIFTGPKYGQELANYYGASDVFMFPSKSDTLGLVMLEALASGLPVVGFNVMGPKDVIGPDGKTGFLATDNQDLQDKALLAWESLQTGAISREDCRKAVVSYSWPQCISTLLENLKVHLWPEKTPSSTEPEPEPLM